MQKNKKTIALIIGGRSTEHKISLLSSKNIYRGLDKSKYDVKVLGVDPQGHWYLYEDDYLVNPDNANTIALNAGNRHPVTISLEGKSCFYLGHVNPVKLHIDVAFPMMHGAYGEDGTIQGFFKMLDIPFVGSGVLSSALCMDKDFTKRILQAANIKVAPFIALHYGEKLNFDGIVSKLGLPVFVKPANSGSSVGVSKAASVAELQESIDYAFKYDDKVLVETQILGRELECAVLGHRDPVASQVGEIKNNCGFYSYSEKYLESHPNNLIMPADVPEEITRELQATSIATFKALSCSGMARVDFFLTENNQVLVNEVNTIPGFTSISMYPSLWDKTGKPIGELLDDLISIALARDAATARYQSL